MKEILELLLTISTTPNSKIIIAIEKGADDLDWIDVSIPGLSQEIEDFISDNSLWVSEAKTSRRANGVKTSASIEIPRQRNGSEGKPFPGANFFIEIS